MNKIILTTVFLTVAVFTVAYLYFSNISAGNRNNDKALSVIPNDASIIFEFKNDQSIYELFSDYTVFDAVIGKQKQDEIKALKSFLFSFGPFIQATQGKSIYLSFHPLADSVSFLWTMPLPENIDSREVSEILTKNKTIIFREGTGAGPVYSETYIPSVKKTFYFQAGQGVLSGSFSKPLLQNSMDTKGPKIDEEMANEIMKANQQNQNTPATIFINFRNSVPFLAKFLKGKPDGSFSLLNNFNAIATLNMNFKSDALMFNGITTTDTIKQNYINLFLHQKAVKNPIKRILPDNTSNFISYGISDYEAFHNDLKKLLKLRNELEQLTAFMISIREESGINTDRDIKKYWDQEFMTFQLSTQEKFGAIHLTNGRQLQFFMEPISTEYSEGIRHIEYPGIFYYYFGDAFKQFNKPFYAIIENHMILSNSPGSLRRYVDRYSQNLLVSDERFMDFDQYVADRSNISIFVHNKNSQSNYTSNLKSAYAKNLNSSTKGQKDFYGFSYQWTSESDHFFTNFYAGYSQVPVQNTILDTNN
ncbi:hypothetical protein GZH53_14375 [Flavihumibacter sp. R14]|nr:hypothetical protein [Flavihumibacter soli]